MKNFAAQVAGIATLALAALPLAALSTAAHASPVHVRVADLNLASIEGRTALHSRVEAAADQFCAREKALSQKSACKSGVHAEVQEKLAQRQILVAAR
jgi:UrcA family protein